MSIPRKLLIALFAGYSLMACRTATTGRMARPAEERDSIRFYVFPPRPVPAGEGPWLAVDGYRYEGSDVELRWQGLDGKLATDLWGGGRGFYGTVVHLEFSFEAFADPTVEVQITWYTDMGAADGEVEDLIGLVSVVPAEGGGDALGVSTNRWEGQAPAQISFSFHGREVSDSFAFEYEGKPSWIQGSFLFDPSQVEGEPRQLGMPRRELRAVRTGRIRSRSCCPATA